MLLSARAMMGPCSNTKAAMDTKKPLHFSELPPEVWYEGSDREIRGRALCDVGGRAKIGVGMLELGPGCNTKPGHYHTQEEEHLFVLDGQATLYLGDQTHPLVPGDYVCFPAGQPTPHHIENHGPDTFRYLMIGDRQDDDVVVSADSD